MTASEAKTLVRGDSLFIPWLSEETNSGWIISNNRNILKVTGLQINNQLLLTILKIKYFLN
jgi:hypothetical protein